MIHKLLYIYLRIKHSYARVSPCDPLPYIIIANYDMLIVAYKKRLSLQLV